MLLITSPISCFAPVASCYFWTRGRTKFSAASLMGMRMMGLQSLLHIHEGERRDFFHKGVILHKLSKQIRAVQSSPFPPCAARRRGGPGGGLGTPGLAPGPRPPRPHLRKK